MCIEVKLDSEGRPGGYSQVTKPQFLVDEVEVVMDTLGLGGTKGRPVVSLGVVGFKGGTGFHGGENVHQPGMVASLRDNLLDPLFFSELPLPTDILDLQSIFSSQSLCVLSNFIAERFSPLRVVEEANLSNIQVQSQSTLVTDLRNGPGKDHSVKTGEDPAYLVAVTLGQELHRDLRRRWALDIDYRNGKGYGGLNRMDENMAVGLMVWGIR